MKLTIAFMFIAVLLVVPSGASAEFTPDEARSLLQLRTATLNLSTGARDYLSLLMNTATTDETRPALGTAMRYALTASREANVALGLLLNVITEQVATPQYENLAGLSRAERVSLAWWRAIERS